MAPQFYWLWAPVNFDDVCTHFDVNEHGDGQQWHRSGYVIPVLGDAATDPVLDTGGLGVSAEPMSSVQCTIDWEPGTRRATHARIEMSPWNASPLTVDLEPIVTFQMMGIGYFHPEWSHGVFKGDLAVGGERWNTADARSAGDPERPHPGVVPRSPHRSRRGAGRDGHPRAARARRARAIGPHRHCSTARREAGA